MPSANLEDTHEAEGEERVQEKLYTETSIFRVISMMDTMLSLVEEDRGNFVITDKFLDPNNLKRIVLLSCEASP